MLALLLMLIVFVVFDQFVWKPQRIVAEAEKASQTDTPAAVVTKDSIPEAIPEMSTAAVSAFDVSVSEQSYSLSNELTSITFSNRGAVVNSVKLHSFKMRDGSDVELIPAGTAVGGLSLEHPESVTDLSKQIFSAVLHDERTLSFYLKASQDTIVVIKYTLNDDYGLQKDIMVQNYLPIKGINLSFESGIADTEENLKSKNQDYKFIISANNELKKLDLKKLAKTGSEAVSTFQWAASRSKYFTLAVKEQEPQLINSYNASVVKTGEADNSGSPAFSIQARQNIAKSNWQQSFVLYMGPADQSILKTYGKGMENIAELGYHWLRWISGAFAWFLKWLHSYIRNYGVVIIIFSLLLKIILHPLSHKQLDSSLKMQRLQPQVQEIQQKYKSDPKRMQAELSQLYKEAGTSPLSGCLPLLLQMPIFFSLYSVLRYSLDMRNAHFVGWLKDLSEPDPFMILPIIMGIFMVLQSLLMRPPQQNIDQMDDKQKAAAQSAKMMTWIMPVMMFFIFRNMPAGLVLYWTVFNIFSVIQQYYLQKHLKTKEVSCQ